MGDCACPNIWGRLRTQTSGAGLRHEMSLLSGLPLAGFNATCAHEYAHVWLNENLSAARRKTISSDAVEGFCELIAYLLMDAEMENGQKEWIKLNAYTRGQIELFIEAEQLYGFNDVLKWIRYGTDDRLSGDELGRLRRVELPQPTAPPLRELANAANPHSVARETLTLKAIFWNQQQSLAIINDQTFGLQQQREVRLAMPGDSQGSCSGQDRGDRPGAGIGPADSINHYGCEIIPIARRAKMKHGVADGGAEKNHEGPIAAR